jgi:hypothetical protein
MLSRRRARDSRNRRISATHSARAPTAMSRTHHQPLICEAASIQKGFQSESKSGANNVVCARIYGDSEGGSDRGGRRRLFCRHLCQHFFTQRTKRITSDAKRQSRPSTMSYRNNSINASSISRIPLKLSSARISGTLRKAPTTGPLCKQAPAFMANQNTRVRAAFWTGKRSFEFGLWVWFLPDEKVN